MLDNILIVVAVLFLIIQLIVACQMCFIVAKSKKEGGMVVSNFWCQSLPYLLLFFSVVMLICAIKTNDTVIVLLPILLSMSILFDMHIFYADGEKVNHYYFLLQKNVCTSLEIQDNLVVAEFGDKKGIVRISPNKIEMLKAYLKEAEADNQKM